MWSNAAKSAHVVGRTLVAVLLTAITFGAVAALASSAGAYTAEGSTPSSTAGAYPPPGLCTITTGSAQLAPNQSVSVSGGGFPAGTSVSIYLDSKATLLTTAAATSTGTFSATVVMPADLKAGVHQLIAGSNNQTCQIGATYTAATVTPSGGTEAATTTNDGLAFTGFAAITAAVIGAALLVGGAAFQVVGRRRRHS